jgi:hypothetical protein
MRTPLIVPPDPPPHRAPCLDEAREAVLPDAFFLEAPKKRSIMPFCSDDDPRRRLLATSDFPGLLDHVTRVVVRTVAADLPVSAERSYR